MKILAIGSPEVPVALWRIVRPMRELAKHTDWEIDFQNNLVESISGNDDKEEFTEVELEQAARHLGEYDIVFVSYYMLTASLYAFMLAVTNRHDTRFVIDFDDNIFAINEDNPIWLTVTHERIHDLQTIAAKHPRITTTTEALAHELRKRRDTFLAGTVTVVPNLIPDDYKHPALDHGDKVVIGYFGGSSHFADLNESGFPKAMRDIMRKYKNVHFRAAGVPLDVHMPKARESFIDSVRGEGWVTDVFPQLDMDIVVAPLLKNVFNEGKSNIKWLEATRAGAAVIASDVGPYHLLEGNVDALLVDNTRGFWYKALEFLVINEQFRHEMVNLARAKVAKDYRLEDHWDYYQQLFEGVMAAPAAIS